MAICTFLGHRDIYEKGLYTRLSEVMREIVLQNKEVEFLFCSSGPFYDLCLAAALEVKQHFPEKSITITWVVNADERELFVKSLTQYEARIPTCMIDKVISPSLPTPLSEPDCIVAHKRVMRWAIQQSTHLISYLYFAFCETENRQYTYAHHRGLTILDVACKDTASYISQRVNALPERQQLITKKVAQEQPQKDIGQLLGITTSAVRQELKQACRSLRAAAKKRHRKTLIDTPLPPIKCSIFSMGAVIYETLSSFEQVVLFLIDKYYVTQFKIEAEYCNSGYMSVLKRLSKVHLYKIQIVAITHYTEMGEDKLAEVAAQLCPPCHAVENIDTHAERLRSQRLRAAKAMIDQSDFCICNLCENPLAGSIKRHISKTKGAKLLDISQKCVGAL